MGKKKVETTNIAFTKNTLQTKRSAYLASIVKGKPEEEDVREGLDDAEEPIHNPVSQPLCVVLLIVALDGFNAEWTKCRRWMREVTVSAAYYDI